MLMLTLPLLLWSNNSSWSVVGVRVAMSVSVTMAATATASTAATADGDEARVPSGGEQVGVGLNASDCVNDDEFVSAG